MRSMVVAPVLAVTLLAAGAAMAKETNEPKPRHCNRAMSAIAMSTP